MSKSLKQQVQQELRPQLEKEVGKKLYRGYTVATASTPVDTGQMRSSWTLSKAMKYYKQKRRPPGHIHGLDLFAGRLGRNRAAARRFSKSIDWLRMKSIKIVIANSMDYSSYISATHAIETKVVAAVK
jgi:hypothetical protein